MSWQQMSQLKELAIAPGVLQEAMQATRPCRRLWTMHAGLALTAPLYNPMASAISPIPSKLMPRMLLTVTFRERAWPLAPVTSLAVPPLQKLIPVMDLVCIRLLWALLEGHLLNRPHPQQLPRPTLTRQHQRPLLLWIMTVVMESIPEWALQYPPQMTPKLHQSLLPWNSLRMSLPA